MTGRKSVVTGVKVVDGKLVRKIGFRAKIKAHKTSRLVKAWRLKAAPANKPPGSSSS